MTTQLDAVLTEQPPDPLFDTTQPEPKLKRKYRTGIKPKQITRVYDALVDGPATAVELAFITGIYISNVYTYLSSLRRDGKVYVVARRGRSLIYSVVQR